MRDFLLIGLFTIIIGFDAHAAEPAQERFDLVCASADPTVIQHTIHFSIDTKTKSYCEGVKCTYQEALAEMTPNRIVLISRSGMGGLDGINLVQTSVVFDRATDELTWQSQEGNLKSRVSRYKCHSAPYSSPAFTTQF